MSATAPVTPPIWREAAAGLEVATLLRDPVMHGAGVPDGGGRPVVLVPGFMAGDASLTLLTRWLRRVGYHPVGARIGPNRDCASAAVDRLEARVREEADNRGQRVALIGQSRGGCLARALAVRAPDAVAGIVTLGSPLRDQLAAHPAVIGVVRAVARMGDRGARGVLSSECRRGACCAGFRRALAGPFPADVGFVSVYSRADGLVDWRACLDPAAEQLEVPATHLAMAANAHSYRAIARALPRFWLSAPPDPSRTPRAATR